MLPGGAGPQVDGDIPVATCVGPSSIPNLAFPGPARQSAGSGVRQPLVLVPGPAVLAQVIATAHRTSRQRPLRGVSCAGLSHV